jgi:hypothetical protein
MVFLKGPSYEHKNVYKVALTFFDCSVSLMELIIN